MGVPPVSAALDILLGAVVVLAITALTGWFVAQEFGYMAVDRARLRARAGAGDAGARRALDITGRTSFMLSGAQLGITVTGLLVGYVAEPLIGDGLGELLGGVGIPSGVGVAIGTVLALLFATVVQMVFGELFPKNLAIARPEPVARALALSTALYLRCSAGSSGCSTPRRTCCCGPCGSSRSTTSSTPPPRATSERSSTSPGDSGDLPPELSTVLDRVLDFADRPARAAMIPRPRVATAAADATVGELVERMAAGTPATRCWTDGRGRRRRRGLPARRPRAARGASSSRLRVRDVARPRPCSSPTRCRCPPCWTRCAPPTTSSPASSTSTAGSPA